MRGDVAKWLRRGSAKPLFGGSNPPVASTLSQKEMIVSPSLDLRHGNFNDLRTPPCSRTLYGCAHGGYRRHEACG